MIVFSLTLFLFSSFTFFYKIRISKKPRTPRSTSWWVCLFKQCQCSRSRCTEFLCWFGGDVPGAFPSGVDSVRTELLPSTLPRVPALEGALTCHLCPCLACFHGTCRGVFPWSPLPLCQVSFHLPSRWQRAWAAPRSRPAGSRVIQAPLEMMPKQSCRALPSLRESWSHWECRERRLISPVWYHPWGSGFSLSAWWWQVPSAIPVCNWTWTFPGRSTAAVGQLQIISGATECSVLWLSNMGSQRVKTPRTAACQNWTVPWVHSRPAKL